MIGLFLALLVGLVGAGIVVAMLRDSGGHGYPSGYRRRTERVDPFEPDAPGARRGVLAGYDDRTEFAEPAPEPSAAPVRRRKALAAAVPRTTSDGAGESRSGLLVAGVALSASAVLLLVIVARPWDGGAAPTTDAAPGGGDAGASAEATATAPGAVTTRSATATPTATATRTSTPAPANVATLAVQARQQANVRVTVDGRTEFEGTLGAGESRSWAGSARVQLWTDNGKNVAVTVNGFDLGALATAVGHPDWNTVDWGWAAGWRP